MRRNHCFPFFATVAAILLALPPTSAHAGDDEAATCRHRNVEIERDIGFCQAVRVGDTLYVSGITAPGPMETAVPRVYEGLKSVLEANGLSMRHVVKENVYATDLDALIAQKDARKPLYEGNLPAATWVQVERLYLPEFVIEVEVIAHYPSP
jgi:2-iminobutanoate/2-iminopropanoate deaminase